MTKHCTFFWISVFAFFFSCDGGSDRIIGDFSFWYSDLESSGTITYRSQAIIDTNAYVIDYWNDYHYIVAKTFFFRSQTKDPIGMPTFYVINLAEYRKDPEQLRSVAVTGPLSPESVHSYFDERKYKIDKSLLKLLK